MTVRISLMREPVAVTLAPPFDSVRLVLRRLTSPEFAICRHRALTLIADREAVLIILHRNGLLQTGGDAVRAFEDANFRAGWAEWLAAIECFIAAVDTIEGVSFGEPGAEKPLALPRDRTRIAGVADPLDPADLEVRLAVEQLLLNEALQRQITAEIDAAARLMVAEGKGSGI